MSIELHRIWPSFQFMLGLTLALRDNDTEIVVGVNIRHLGNIMMSTIRIVLYYAELQQVGSKDTEKVLCISLDAW